MELGKCLLSLAAGTILSMALAASPAVASPVFPYITGDACAQNAYDWVGDVTAARWIGSPQCYDVNPGAPAGTVQWDSYTAYCIGTQKDEYYAGWGPYSSPPESTPLKTTFWYVGGC